MKSTKSKTQPIKKSNDIIQLITQDHKPLKKMILVLKDPKILITKKRLLFENFATKLTTHLKAEESSLYFHMKNDPLLRMEGLQGDIEHHLLEQLISEVHQIKNNDDLWMVKVKLIAELIDRHIQTEEQHVFKKIKKVCNLDTRMDIGMEYSRHLNSDNQWYVEGWGASSHIKTFFDNATN